MDARRAIELKAPGYDKGRASKRFCRSLRFSAERSIYIGDDITDEAGFAAVSARGGFAYSVGRLRPGASGTFASPGEVRAWLAKLADRRGA